MDLWNKRLSIQLSIIILITIPVVHCAPSCASCPVGEGVIESCSADRATVCAPCLPGRYSDTLSPTQGCLPCSRCPPDHFPLRECTLTKDTVCGSCSSPEVQSNENYMKLCSQEEKPDPESESEEAIAVYQSEDDPENSGAPDRLAPAVFDDSLQGSGDEGFLLPGYVVAPPEVVTLPDSDSEELSEILEEEGLLETNPGVGNKETNVSDSYEVVTYELFAELGSGELFEAGSGEELVDLSTPSLDRKSTTPKLGDNVTTTQAISNWTTTPPLLEIPIDSEESSESKEMASGATLSASIAEASSKNTVLIAVLVTVFGVAIIVVLFFVIRHVRRKKKGYNPDIEYVDAPQNPPEKGDQEMVRVTSVRPTSSEVQPSADSETTPLRSAAIEETDATQVNGGTPVANNTSAIPDALKPSAEAATEESKHQSPINITTDDVTNDSSLESNPLQIDYQGETKRQITNDGSKVKITFEDNKSILGGGPLLDKKYVLYQCHIHWGSTDSQGSEHCVNGKQYPAELHLLHWNTTDYKSCAEAAKSKGGLVSIAIFIELGTEHEGLKVITDCLEKITYKGQVTELSCETISPSILLPVNQAAYWTYSGSQTEPPYTENVTWIVFRDVLTMSEDQMKSFRGLRSHEKDEDHGNDTEGHLVDNFRTLANLNDRTVRSSFT